MYRPTSMWRLFTRN